jgi:probable rRNA maturation factor
MAEARAGQTPLLDVLVASTLWHNVPELEVTLRRAIAAAAGVLASRASARELAIVLTDNAEICALNLRYRGRNCPTNVLAFGAAPVGRGGAAPGLGDIVIAFETAAAEASAETKPLAHHVAHLGVHGFLHLMGYDHHSDDAAEVMERLERKILARLGIPNPYGLETGAHRHA